MHFRCIKRKQAVDVEGFKDFPLSRNEAPEEGYILIDDQPLFRRARL
jgi:hypothetical protein